MKQYHKINSIFKRDKAGKFILDQYSQPEFEYLAGNEWIWDEKVDGTNVRVMWDGEKLELKFGGKTDNAQMPVPLYNKLVERFPIDKFYGFESMCLYGEGFGAGIQKGGKYIKDGVDFVLFDVRIGDWWLKRDAIEDIAKQLDIPIVPIVGKGNLHYAMRCVSFGMKSTWGDFIAEGLVLRPKVPLFTRSGERIITKVKYKDFN